MTKNVLLGDLAQIKGGKRLPKGESLQDIPNNHPYIRVVDMGDKFIKKSTLQYVPNNVFPRISRYITNTDDVLLSIVGTIGLVSIVGEQLDNASLTENCVKLTCNRQKIDPKFLYYYLSSPVGQNELRTGKVGSTQPKLPIYNIAKINVPYIPVSEQKRIVQILETIDQKIELNRRMNETLEQMGQALFKHYFIDNPEADKWDNVQLNELVEHIKKSVKPEESPEKLFSHYSIPAFDDLMEPEEVSGKQIKSNKYSVVNQSILVSKLNPSTPRIWPVIEARRNAVCSTEFQVLQPKQLFGFTYFLLKTDDFTSHLKMCAGGTSNSHRRVNPSDILNYQLAYLDNEVLSDFEEIAVCLLEKIKNNKSEIINLATTRDLLLPRLISGKIEV